MNNRGLIHTISWAVILLISWLPCRADAPATYEIVTTQTLYLPGEPFHITDMRYPDKSNFEARTVTICQPYQGGHLYMTAQWSFSSTAVAGWTAMLIGTPTSSPRP